jgi:endoglucanase
MKKLLLYSLLLLGFSSHINAANPKFITVQGKDVIGVDGKPFLIKGSNLGNWLVPEGYMFKFKNTNSPKLINEMISQVIGPEETSKFWSDFLDSYITQKDIHYLKSIGANSIRVPFNYRMFTSEDYLGANDASRGFTMLDRVVKWCKAEGLYVILDMHCAPGGQTGDNIDDSYGYPFLYESRANRKLTIDIWHKIADRYKNETTVLGYDLLNEPVAHYFDSAKLNPFIEPLYKEISKSIRTVDKNHILFLGGAQWDTNFTIFNQPFDTKIIYTFHKYGDQPNLGSIARFIAFRDKYNVPIYAGETGENTDEWVSEFRQLLENNNIGWHFWPYKKLDSPKNILSVIPPAKYDSLVNYAEAPRASFKELRKLPVQREILKQVLADFLDNCQFSKCKPNDGYIKALGLQPASLVTSTTTISK